MKLKLFICIGLFSLLACQSKNRPVTALKPTSNSATKLQENAVVENPKLGFGNLAPVNAPREERLKSIPKFESFETCRKLTKMEEEVLQNKSVSRADKIKFLNLLLVNLKGAKCKEVVEKLKESLTDDSSVSEYVNRRVEQLEKLSNLDLINLIQSGDPIELDAGVLWDHAGELTIDRSTPGKVKVLGVVKYRDKSVDIVSVFKDSEFHLEDPKISDIADLVRGKYVKFGKTENKAVVATPVTPQESEKSIKDQILDIQDNVERKPAPKNEKQILDASDSSALELCKSEALVVDPLSQALRKEGNEFAVVNAKFSSRQTSTPGSAALERSFWKFGLEDGTALEFRIKISAIKDDKGKSVKKADFSIFKLNEKSQIQKKDKDITASLPRPASIKDFVIYLDESSFSGLEIEIEGLKRCLVKNGGFSENLSLDSIRGYVFFSLLKDEFDYILE